MKKTTALLITLTMAFALIVSGNAIAQETRGDMAVGGAVKLAFPVGGLGDKSGMGFGLDGIFEYGWNENITGVGTIGFMKWGSKDYSYYEWSYSTIKIVGGAKYYLKPGKTGWYGGAEVGFHIRSWTFKVTDPQYQGYLWVDGSASATDFSISPIGGYESSMGESGMRWSVSGILAWAGDVYIGVRVGLIYPLGKGQQATETTDDAMNIEDTIYDFAGVN